MLSRKNIAIVVTCAAVFGVMQLGIEFGRTLFDPVEAQAQQRSGKPSIVTIKYSDNSYMVLTIDADGDVTRVAEVNSAEIGSLSGYSNMSLK